jgi:hypothetical protein
VLLMIGRGLFVRACRLADENDELLLSARAIRHSYTSLAVSVVVGLFFQSLSILLCFTVIAIPILAIFAGIAVATSDQQRTPSLLAALRLLGRYTARPATLIGLMLVLSVAFLIVAINLYFGFGLIEWVAGGLGGVDTTRWSALFSPTSRLFDLLLSAGALALLEPFWLAICFTYVKRVDARRSGADLRAWFADIAGDSALVSAGGER